MNYNELRIRDIVNKDILYYDKEQEKVCHSICQDLGITNLPSVGGTSYYTLINTSFQKRSITDNLTFQMDDLLFDPESIQKFQKNPKQVLFVFDGRVFIGIVHLWDFNDNSVVQAIQDDILLFERRLRQWLILNNFEDSDLLQYFANKAQEETSDHQRRFYASKLESLEKRLKKAQGRSPFQVFDFSDLLSFGNAKASGETFELDSYLETGKRVDGFKILTDLRNMAAHAKDTLPFSEEERVYSVQALLRLVEDLAYFRVQSEKLNGFIHQHPDYITTLRLENRWRLQMIDQRHPNALNYFMNQI